MVKLNEVLFSDIYITPDKIAYIPDNVTPNGLEVLEAEDFDDFFDLMTVMGRQQPQLFGYV